ncbi:MAG: hypothetical protein PHD97_05720 [Bacteroidales bacterium]|nr:hypothetical protein [Bacteroidales bacterium]
MKNNKDVLIEIKGFPLIQHLIRLLCFAWIVFGCFKFYLNPFFFSFTIIISVIIIFVIYEKSIIAKSDLLEICISRWLFIFNKKKKYYYSEMSNLSFVKGSFNVKTFLMSIILNVFKIYAENYIFYSKIIIELKDISVEEISTIGNSRQNEELVKIVKSKINEELD